jgi:lipopolysaccharide/colanic/teichoic acid biosynthesis glycosyltransferase
MFEDRSYKRTFYSAPQSVTSLVAALLEPTITVAVFLAATRWFDEPIARPALAVCLIVFAVTFPGRNRFKDKLLNAATDIVSSWISLLAILFLFAYATNSLYYFEREVLLAWAIATPLLQWLAVWAGRTALRRRALRPHLRSSAIIVQGRLQDMNGVPVVGILETPFSGTNDLTKRTSDVVLASIILVLISPLLLIIAVGVKLSSPGPVIFRQKRNGLDGGEITVYKFRSMRTMDNGPTVPQATKDDPRITPFGAFLRRTSLDELPQFFNVLQGSMSIVGPRPHAVAHIEMYREIIKAYMARHKVKPGISGWA